FDLLGGKSGVTFASDLHVTGEVILTMAARMEPLSAFITMDIQNVESNITYVPSGERRFDNDDYILIGPERIIVRNNRIPTYFVQPNSNDAFIIDQFLNSRPSILDHLTNEITAALMHNIVDNFRQFANKIPVKNYYEYF
ncbi:uncharacterized protein LOC113235018, partial [Hyposmocoma kahamanoa]|uniref:uncharacterized protein LOC113235018 n=1 Tax=Hyposmocoma kahamanoa TaxID=1477025 RepID=UPI000E6D8067